MWMQVGGTVAFLLAALMIAEWITEHSVVGSLVDALR